MTEDDALERFGLPATAADAPAIRHCLAWLTALEAASQGAASTTTMRALAAQLFTIGAVEDALPIWQAKAASMDAACSIDLQLMCGAGLERTRAVLSSDTRSAAQRAHAQLEQAVGAGDFEGFSVERYQADLLAYYRG